MRQLHCWMNSCGLPKSRAFAFSALGAVLGADSVRRYEHTGRKECDANTSIRAISNGTKGAVYLSTEFVRANLRVLIATGGLTILFTD